MLTLLYYNETLSSTRRVKENITPMGEASKNDLRAKTGDILVPKGDRSRPRNLTFFALVFANATNSSSVHIGTS